MSKYLIQPFSVHTKSDISAYFIHFMNLQARIPIALVSTMTREKMKHVSLVHNPLCKLIK